jgi:hypothetical protein
MPTRFVGDCAAQHGDVSGSHARPARTSKQKLAAAAVRDCVKPMVRWLNASGTGMAAVLPFLMERQQGVVEDGVTGCSCSV